MAVATATTKQSPQLRDMLDLLSIQIDTLLESLAGSNLLEARRRITRDLHFEPRPEELQTIARIAADDSTGGPRSELPRRFLGLRILAYRQLKNVLETKTLNAETMSDSAEMLGELVGEAQRLEADLDRAVSADESPNRSDTDYLLKIGDALSCSQNNLIANSVLAHRLAELAESVAAENLEEMESSLSEAEREQIAAFVAENITQETNRATLDAIAIRSHIERHLTAWRELGKPSEDSDARHAQRNTVLERMQQGMIALESVSMRIQTQRDAALVAGVESLAAELRDAGRGLFSMKLRMAPVLRDPYMDVDDSDEAEALREQLRASAAEEAEAEGGPRAETEEEIYLNALKDMRANKETQQTEFRKKHRQSSLQRARRRMKWMVAASVVLAITSAIVNFVILPGSSGAPEAPELSELAPAANVKKVEAAGPLMLTHVKGWNDLDESERRTRVDRLGEIVSEDGFSMLMVVDEYGQAAAAWDQRAGTGLVEAP